MPLNHNVEIELNSLKKPQEVKAEKAEEPYVPFTHASKNVKQSDLDEIILSYLPATQLDAMSQSKTQTCFETQTCIKIPAGKALDKSYKILLERLPKCVYSPGDHGAAVVDYKAIYLFVVKSHENYFNETIKKAFKENKKLYTEKEIEFLKEIIFHYCINFPKQAGVLLNENIRSEKDILLEAMIEAGADIHIGTRENTTFAKAINYCDATIVNALFRKDQDYKAFTKQFYEFSEFDFTRYYYLKAILEFSIENLFKITRDKPELLPFFFNMLDVIIEKRSTHTEYVTNDYLRYEFNYNSNAALNTKFKLLQICQKNMTFSKNDKILLLRNTTKRINNAPTIEGLMNIYKEKHNGLVINFQRHRYLDRIIGLFDKKSQYTNSKIEFIERLQNRAIAIANSEAFVESFRTPTLYLAACQYILDLPFFSDAHCERGVDKDARLGMLQRMKQVKTFIPNAPGPS